ncbi:uncharacterized protein MONOS_3696 [Monocercomonoides exilis]|uniref:uncharacterized protein n=1 Tax=Monocercomonoides exilis TaxID=2049356 RepID=UPI00355AAA83|nr:hypothetical protein MONOS_3696 [Monocercomonoides exilis]|eukprot:MONOS_3696.1-p1 / transcript=MONOS_3696.1 / gene=MONOS_3696 / organism=Monocercomonoides_exilis_PA203 / gene_product=unspecified product / transcript_product=unspecified product / location=Mono_scaffold00089:127750-128622(+) / protein_length=291 / sequence_SO=supercontig / SO=protein_coding / is_pseudo=false
MFSSGGANFQQMDNGLYCEEKSAKEMILHFREIVVKCFRIWISIPISLGITKFIKRDVLGRIAFLLCETASDTTREEAEKALSSAWANLSSNAHIVPHLKRIDEYDLKQHDCLPQPLRESLTRMLMEVCEEEGVIDILWGHITLFDSKDHLDAESEKRMKDRMKANCDLKMCPICAMYSNTNIDQEEKEEEEEEEKEEEEEEIKKEEETKEQGENHNTDDGKYFESPELTSYKECSLKPLAECLNAGRISKNAYERMRYNAFNFFYFWTKEDKCSQNSNVESGNEDCNEI